MRIDYRFKIGLVIALLGLLTLSANPPFLAMAQDQPATPADAGQAAPAEDPTPPPPPPDTTPPVVAGHADVAAAAADASGAVVTFAYPGASDDTDGTVPVDCAPPSGSLFPLGSTVVTCSATDAAGNVGQSSFTVTVTDQTPPQITGGGDVTVDATDPSGAAVDFAIPTASDNVDGQIAVGCDHASGAVFPVGTTVVTCWAQDAAGNNAKPISFAVTVNAPPAPTAVPTDVPTEEPQPTEVPATDTPAPTATDTPSDTPTDQPGSTATPAPTTAPTDAPSGTPADPPSGTPADTPTNAPTEAPGGTPADTPSDVPGSTVTPAPTTAPTDAPSQAPTDVPTNPTVVPTQPPAATPTPKADGETSAPAGPTPDALAVDQALLGSFTIVTDGGPLGVLTSIWGGEDWPISQEFGHTDFSVAHPSWYAYGLDYGLDGYEHPGIDVGMPAGTPLYSPVDGTVEIAGGVPYYTFYGNGQPGVGELLIQTADGDQVILGHMGRIVVEAGHKVKSGQFVGLSGGDNGDHVHLETREVQPLGGYKIVDPRKSFLVPALKAALQRTAKTDNKADYQTLSQPAGHLGAVAQQNSDKYAVITVRRVNCAVDANGNAVATCGNDVLSGAGYTVYNPTSHGTTRVTNPDGKASFGPRAGENVITKDVDPGSFAGAYVSCVAQDSGRVLFAGAIQEPSVTLNTEAGERVLCTWYNLAN
jgi:murein DD-endopeptidase MepM/ murein hydrolase activator NlpD